MGLKYDHPLTDFEFATWYTRRTQLLEFLISTVIKLGVGVSTPLLEIKEKLKLFPPTITTRSPLSSLSLPTQLGFSCLSQFQLGFHSNHSLLSISVEKQEAMGASNKITALLNFIALLCSIPIISAGVWLSSKEDNQCIHLFRWPVLLLGILILLVSLAGFVGSYWNREGLLACYLFFMALLIILLLILLIFAFVVTRPDGSYVVPGKGYKEYRLDGFSFWLRNYVTKSGNWGEIRTCLAQSNMCSKLSQNYGSADQFFLAHISPLQSGCCKPPTVCGHGYVNPTLWINPVNPTADPDCFIWSNDQMQLCYDCNACKAGLLGNLRKEWRRANVILIITVVVLICVYLIACSAFKNAQTEELFRRYKDGWA